MTLTERETLNMAMQIDHQAGFLNIRKIPFDVDAGIGARARIGVIVLATDHTIEYEFRQIVNMPGVAFYESRIPNSPTITPETLKAMENHISDRAALILPGVPFDVMAYGCTSASMVIGERAGIRTNTGGAPGSGTDHTDHRGVCSVSRSWPAKNWRINALPRRHQFFHA